MTENVRERELQELFSPYVQSAIRGCESYSFQQKTLGLWGNPDIVSYYARLKPDASIEYLADSLREVLPDLKGERILCVGGATGRLGRHIAMKDKSAVVIDVDASEEMVAKANKLASQDGLNDRYKSVLGNVFSIPFQDNEFDYVIAHGLFRYIENPEDQKKAANEMSRVSKFGFTIAEGKARDVIYSLKDLINSKLQVKETELPMFRMSLFFMLLKQYERDGEFKSLVNSVNKKDFVNLLIDLAGDSAGILYELRLPKSEIK